MSPGAGTLQIFINYHYYCCYYCCCCCTGRGAPAPRAVVPDILGAGPRARLPGLPAAVAGSIAAVRAGGGGGRSPQGGAVRCHEAVRRLPLLPAPRSSRHWSLEGSHYFHSLSFARLQQEAAMTFTKIRNCACEFRFDKKGKINVDGMQN